jgi:hypothetical protein
VREAVALGSHMVEELEDEADVAFTRRAFTEFADLDESPINIDDIHVGDFFRHSIVLPLISVTDRLRVGIPTARDRRLNQCGTWPPTRHGHRRGRSYPLPTRVREETQ